jgi:hypothetical protein
VTRFVLILAKWLFAGDNYLLLARIHNEKMTAAAISIVHAACEQPHRISASPATVTGGMAAAACPAARGITEIFVSS